jgi:Sigma-70, region 4
VPAPLRWIVEPLPVQGSGGPVRGHARGCGGRRAAGLRPRLGRARPVPRGVGVRHLAAPHRGPPRLDRASQIKAQREREDDTDLATLALPVATKERDVLLIRRLEQLIRRFTPAQRAVITLYYWDDTPVEQIAGVLGMPENTVKTHLSRARAAALRAAWQSTEGRR